MRGRQLTIVHHEQAHDISKREIWIRSGGKCECTASCGHHQSGRCGITLLEGMWSSRCILPAWMRHKHDGTAASMFEAVCEACRLNPSLPATACAVPLHEPNGGLAAA